jgi:F-type H+-transporting ATPase subunit a
MSGKNILLLILSIFLLELAVLAVMGGFGGSAGKEAEEWFSLGPVAFYKHGLRLEVIEKSEFLHLDGTPEDQPTFWEINLRTTKMILAVDVILLVGAVLIIRSLRGAPGRLQGVFEIVLDLFQGIVKETLGKHADRHLPTIVTLFLFIWFSNLIGIIPLFSEPTRDVNVPVGQMLVMILLVHIEAIRVKGVKKYIKEYFEPFFIMLPLNVIGEMAKGVSLSFRLFGNMSGGAIIILVVSYLLKYTIIPVGLNLFFGIFIGTVQAFVFTMLSMTYIAVAISE